VTRIGNKAFIIPVISVRNISEETDRAMRPRTDSNERSIEAEARAILEGELLASDRVKVGSALAAIGARYHDAGIDFRPNMDGTEAAEFE
jgi:plasmid stability protein